MFNKALFKEVWSLYGAAAKTAVSVNKLACNVIETAAVLYVDEAGSPDTLVAINRTTRRYNPQKYVFLVLYITFSKIQIANCDGQLSNKSSYIFRQVLLLFTFYFLMLSVLLKISTCSKF